MSVSVRVRNLTEACHRAPQVQLPGAVDGERLTITLTGPRVAAVDWLAARGVVRFMGVFPLAVTDANRAALVNAVAAINSTWDGALLVVRKSGVFADVIVYMDPDYSISGTAYDRALAFVISAVDTHGEHLRSLGRAAAAGDHGS